MEEYLTVTNGEEEGSDNRTSSQRFCSYILTLKRRILEPKNKKVILFKSYQHNVNNHLNDYFSTN